MIEWKYDFIHSILYGFCYTEFMLCYSIREDDFQLEIWQILYIFIAVPESEM